jgi:hypothetical protein
MEAVVFMEVSSTGARWRLFGVPGHMPARYVEGKHERAFYGVQKKCQQ